ncbi:ERI1 exoribonuclease 3-like isoform X2 [Frankliniella occidentalis]|uniref:ERI1 exoribonuclease 3-like isoform X2 n=1 Tax=Frankliniella occidentalis TaxID=133901 RepID=A0A6J1TAF9_FRAOC|nr:ERI1 exoribonuclease 3-like isoform X2 [Frankliniella occidentalis]
MSFERNTRKKNHQTSQPQRFKYFLVLDFEATCDNNFFPEMEVIEFPCLKIDSSTFETLGKFHIYVRPVKHPLLTPFCVNLTGISQEMVDGQLPFSEALTEFLKWIANSDTLLHGPQANSALVTCGDWDLLKMLPNQCALSGIPIPSEMKSWINIKKSFLHSTGLYPHGIKDMLAQLNLEHEGRLHSGIDDCRNIVKIMHGLAARGHIFQITRSFSNRPPVPRT